MAYEVTKLVHGRPYRYRVRSERDPATGAYRNRWTYLGRADAAALPTAIRPRRNAREALLDALGRLFDGDDPDAVTAAAVSTEAGVAHGTFYRYFRNKQDAIVALLERVREERANELDATADPPATLAAARAAIRRWAEELLRSPARHGALFRALYVLSSRDAALLAHRRARRDLFIERLRAYLAVLAERGFARVDDPSGTAAALAAMIEGVFREAILTVPLDEARIATIVGVIERAVFGRF